MSNPTITELPRYATESVRADQLERGDLLLGIGKDGRDVFREVLQINPDYSDQAAPLRLIVGDREVRTRTMYLCRDLVLTRRAGPNLDDTVSVGKVAGI